MPEREPIPIDGFEIPSGHEKSPLRQRAELKETAETEMVNDLKFASTLARIFVDEMSKISKEKGPFTNRPSCDRWQSAFEEAEKLKELLDKVLERKQAYDEDRRNQLI